MNSLVSSLFDRNWYAALRLARRSRRRRTFVCRGRIQLTLDPSAQVEATDERTYIGVPMFGPATPRGLSTVIWVGPKGLLRLNAPVIGRGANISVAGGAVLDIGHQAMFSGSCRIACSQHISIGRECMIAHGATLLDDDGHGLGPPPYSAPIVLEDRVWVAWNAMVLKGVTIGAGSIVAAGAVVTRSCPPRSLLAGVPARIIRSDIEWTDAARCSPELTGRNDCWLDDA